MIDFACKEFDLEDIIKCGLGLTKAEYSLLKFFTKKENYWFTTEDLANDLSLNLSTIQRAVKKMYEKEILKRTQNNLAGGGYTYVYQISSKENVRKLVLLIIKKWIKRVEAELSNW